MTEEEFAAQLRSATSSLFRVEAYPTPALAEEQADFERFLAGNPTPPDKMSWYRPWVDQVTQWASQGITLTRVRVLAEPPTDYQRWLLWGHPHFTSIGEDIRYMNVSKALRAGLPLEDWWLGDSRWVIEMRFTPDGEVGGKTLITDPREVASYCALRDLALENATVSTVAA